MQNNRVSVATTAVVAILTLLIGFFTGLAFSGNGDDIKNTIAENVPGMSGEAKEDNSGVAFTLQVSNLSDTQQAMLKTMGIDESELMITNAMVTCAEAKLGAGRTSEIRNGATPTFTEGAELVACYNG